MTVDIDKRSRKFAIQIITLVNILPKTSVGITIGNQIIRSGTSIGANIEEALGGHTKLDFIHSMNIAKKEARETRYWLNLIMEAHILEQSAVTKMLEECEEIVAILTAIVKQSKINSK